MITVDGLGAFIQSWTDTTVIFVVPLAQTGSIAVALITPMFAQAKTTMTVLGPAPLIFVKTLPSTTIGSTLVVDGQSFGPHPQMGNDSVKIGGLVPNDIQWSATRISFTVPDLPKAQNA